MSRGFGSIQKKVLYYLEKNRIGCRMDILEGIAGKNYTKSQRSMIYRAIAKLIKEGVIVNSRFKSLQDAFRPHVMTLVQSTPKILTVNTESELYKKFKQK